MRYGLALIGTGYMARKHCEALAAHPDARLITICSTDRSRETAAGFKSLYGFVRATTGYALILSDPEIDVVFICSPDHLHTEQVCAALQAGKHVFCEKPLARTEGDFHKIAKALKKSDRILQVGMNCRFRDQYSRARDLVLAGELGSLRFLRGTYIVNAVASVRKNEKSWWADFPAGISPFLHGGGIHCLDLLRWTGGEVDSVFARATGLELGPQLGADTFSISMQFASGAIGELLVAASAFRPNDFSLELWLSGGSILGTKVFRHMGDSAPAVVEAITVEQRTIDLGLQFSDMVQAIQSGSDPLNSFTEAAKNFTVLQAIEESVRTGNAVNIIEKTGRNDT